MKSFILHLRQLSSTGPSRGNQGEWSEGVSFPYRALGTYMKDKGPLNQRKCDECGQVTMTRYWQEVKFCANCGVEVDSTEADRQDHLSVGMTLSYDEVDRLIDGEEISLARAVGDDQHLTVHLKKGQ